MQLMLDHKLSDLWDVDHLVAQRVWILTAESLTATAAGGGEMGNDLLALLRGEEITAGARMPVLAASLAARALALPLTLRLETVAVNGWWLGRVPIAAALLLLQLSDTGGQCFLLGDQMLHQCSDRWRCRLPVTVSNAGWWGMHLGPSLPEIQADFGELSRAARPWSFHPRERLPTKNGSVESLKVSCRCGCNEKVCSQR
jgi:hypothetical protein